MDLFDMDVGDAAEEGWGLGSARWSWDHRKNSQQAQIYFNIWYFLPYNSHSLRIATLCLRGVPYVNSIIWRWILEGIRTT